MYTVENAALRGKLYGGSSNKEIIYLALVVLRKRDRAQGREMAHSRCCCTVQIVNVSKKQFIIFIFRFRSSVNF